MNQHRNAVEKSAQKPCSIIPIISGRVYLARTHISTERAVVKCVGGVGPSSTLKHSEKFVPEVIFVQVRRNLRVVAHKLGERRTTRGMSTYNV